MKCQLYTVSNGDSTSSVRKSMFIIFYLARKLNTLTNNDHWRCKLGGEVFNSSAVSLVNEVF